MADKIYKTPTTIDELINKPIESGYLLAFCESQYSSENMRYVIEIDRFIDYFLLDKINWDKQISYRQIDYNIGLDNLHDVIVIPTKGEDLKIGGELEWPSSVVSRQSVVDHIIKIWNNFISSDASTQICIPSKVLANTIHRLEHLHLYGKDVFNETLIDPIKTLTNDVLPRFLHSEIYSEMAQRMSLLYPLPTARDFSIELPKYSSVIDWPDENLTIENLRTNSWHALLQDSILFNHFLKYNQSIVSSENLLCARYIVIYMSLWEDNKYVDTSSNLLEYVLCNGSYSNDTMFNTLTSGFTSNPINHNEIITNDLITNPSINQITNKHIANKINDIIYKIVQYFILSNSIYEISLSDRKKKYLLRQLGSPTYNLFVYVLKSVVSILVTNYSQYSNNTQLLNDLIKFIKNEKSKNSTDSKREHKRNSKVDYKPDIKVDSVKTESHKEKESKASNNMKCLPIFR